MLLDTNILINSKLRKYVENNFQRGNISMVSILELRKLLTNKSYLAKGALAELMKSVNNETFYEPYCMNAVLSKYSQYELAIINICKERKAVLVSSNPAILALAWKYGVKTFYYYKE